MVRYKKTYGIDNFAEKQINIMMGKASLSFLFSGGASTGHGNTPAQFTTSEPIFQHAIEHCPLFLKGGIKLLNQTMLESEPVQQETPSLPTEGTSEVHAERMEKVRASKDAKEAKEESIEANPFNIVEITCIEDAKQHLMENYGYTVRSLKDTKGVIEAAKANNVFFKGCKELEQ